MTTRRLELATQALATALSSLWTAEKELEKAQHTHGSAVEQHRYSLDRAHEAMGDFKDAADEWNHELGPTA